MNIINNINPLFKTWQAVDSKDFIIFVLEQLHKELKWAVNIPNNNNSIIQPLNQYAKNYALIIFSILLKRNVLLYQIYSLDSLKQLMNAFNVKIEIEFSVINVSNYMIQFILRKYLLAQMY